jgi:hypothetical protein
MDKIDTWALCVGLFMILGGLATVFTALAREAWGPAGIGLLIALLGSGLARAAMRHGGQG